MLRWRTTLQFCYNVVSFLVIIYILLFHYSSMENLRLDQKYQEKMARYAASVDRRVSQVERTILQARESINTLKSSVSDKHLPIQQAISSSSSLHTPYIYVITPTYMRWTQKAELVRIAHSLAASAIPIQWIIVEDTQDKLPAQILLNFQERFSNWLPNLKITVLTAATDPKFKLQSDDPNWLFPRGAAQRNAGIDWVVGHTTNKSALVYFADDDNTYDHQLFPELCQTSGPVGLLPVGIVGGLKWEGPLCRRGEVLLFHTAWKPERPFPLDMAGFVVKVSLLLENPNARFSYYTRRGYLETDFLLKVLKLDNYAEKGLTLAQVGKLARERTVALADDCSKILVWHTRTEKPKAKDELRRIKEGRPSPDMEV